MPIHPAIASKPHLLEGVPSSGAAMAARRRVRRGDLEMPEADRTARQVCPRAGAVVVSVDHRLCLDGVHHPVPHDDVVATSRWVRDSHRGQDVVLTELDGRYWTFEVPTTSTGRVVGLHATSGTAASADLHYRGGDAAPTAPQSEEISS
ncbi:alpha/beta hydrolase fold domain-containing protein [Geodermatophilus sp. TF02-6]|uniref:alpha/beta hydrolase fold domain-containing protein n=1 Tax=Geodermatophilus sp. TF02-6 TaxID=2250575 RepID=UPI0018F59B2B|nr:alpha/beta hydrolase fold domain-containing protein [Geodermatophilus sp. TF02-6]